MYLANMWDELCFFPMCFFDTIEDEAPDDLTGRSAFEICCLFPMYVGRRLGEDLEAIKSLGEDIEAEYTAPEAIQDKWMHSLLDEDRYNDVVEEWTLPLMFEGWVDEDSQVDEVDESTFSVQFEEFAKRCSTQAQALIQSYKRDTEVPCIEQREPDDDEKSTFF